MTTTAISPAKVKEALEKTGLDWLLRFWGGTPKTS